MRLIIKDYLLQLKEKDELDLLVCNLLLQMGYVTDNKPETGNRQYGVDIRAHNSKEVLLCVVKQGDLDRKMWDSDPNAVRQSLDEIKDVYRDFIYGVEKEKKLRAVVITNGEMKEAVRTNWNGYVKRTIESKEDRMTIDFWDIDQLTLYVQKYLFSEYIFGDDMQRTLRRALYFMGESDYRNDYFESIIDYYFARLNQEENAKKIKKDLASLYMASQMIAQYAAEEMRYKISIMVTEYLLIQYWKYLLDKKYFGRKMYVEWLLKFLNEYEKWNERYYENVKEVCEGKDRIPPYNPVEQRVILYEMLGYLTSYAYYLSFKDNKQDKTARKKCEQVCIRIIMLINNYPQLRYAPYDGHAGTVSMLYRLLCRMERTDDVRTLLYNQCLCFQQYYILDKKYPTAEDSFADAVNIYLDLPKGKYETSGFWGTMLEWMVVIEEPETYDALKVFLQEDLKNVTKCVWFLRAEEEAMFYKKHAMICAGEGVAIQIKETFEDLKENVNFIFEQYQNERFSFEEYSFEALEFIVCRYYAYLPRVKREEKWT